MGYFLAHNSVDVFHHGELHEGQVVSTGQPNLEYFENLEDLKVRLSFFGVTFYENNYPNDLGNILEGDVS